MEPSLNTWTTLFLAAVAQGIFLSFLIISRKEKRTTANILLSAIILLFSFIMLYCVAFWTRYLTLLPPIFNLTLGLTYVIGPLMWLYVSEVQYKITSFKKALWHFIPFAIHNLLLGSTLINPGYFTDFSITRPLVVFQNLHLLIYSWFIITSAYHGHMNWVKKIALAYAAYALCFFSYYAMSWTGILRLEYDYMVSFGMVFFIYFVGYYGYHHDLSITKKYRNSGISESASKQLFERVMEYLQSHKSYLDANLKLADIATELSLSSHIISQVVNQQTSGSITDLINKLRVEEAISLMQKKAYAQEKLMAIAYDSGFANKVSFNNAFKKFTSLSPSAYRKTYCAPAKLSIAS